MSRMLTRTGSYGSYGARSGANTATSSAIPTIAMPMTPMRCRRNDRQARRGVVAVVGAVTSSSAVIGSVLAHAWIEHPVNELGNEIGDDDGEGDNQERALQHRIVAVGDGLDGERTESRPGEDRLHLDRARH